MIKIVDGFLPDPVAYREEALRTEYRDYDFGHCVFRGIGAPSTDGPVPSMIANRFDGFKPTISFLRRSPYGQKEPHFIHTDVDMGQWSAILYLNPDPPDGDGTSFWRHKPTGTVGSDVPHERSAEGNDTELWHRQVQVDAKFNRLLVFSSCYFHSRSLFDNWGAGDKARLTQVTFGVHAKEDVMITPEARQ